MLNFVLPKPCHRADVLAFYREFEASGSECIGFKNRKNFEVWLTEMQNRHTGQNLPAGFVQEDFYLCYHREKLVGVFSLKFTLTSYLLDFGGHIGYAVRPSLQNRGYATKMLAQGLEIAKGLGLKKVLCVCNEDNLPSKKVILKNGGVLENKLFDPEEAVWVNRYWITL